MGGRTDLSLFPMDNAVNPLYQSWLGTLEPLLRVMHFSPWLLWVCLACILLLQWLYPRSKPREQSAGLTQKLHLWQESKFEDHLAERAIQQRMHRQRWKPPGGSRRTRLFTNLIRGGSRKMLWGVLILLVNSNIWLINFNSGLNFW